MSLPLTARLRAETSALHAQAERSPFMAALTDGRLDRHAYCLMLRNLEPAYSAMEAGLVVRAGHAAVSPIFEPALFRTEALRLDLRALHGPSWEHELRLLPSGENYAQRLLALSQSSPELLAAHVYVRYLGDLNGGQILRGIISLTLGLRPDGPGMAFYEFGEAEAVSVLTRELRAGLNEAARTQAAQDALVAEAKWAFDIHCTLFEELARAARRPAADFRPLH